jgi:hypothetical protein
MVWWGARHGRVVTTAVRSPSEPSLHEISRSYGLSKSAVDRHKGSHVSVPLAQDAADLAAEFQAARQADHRQCHKLRKHACAVMRAFEGWGQIHSVEEWQTACKDDAKWYESGRFLLERLGAERFMDPQLMAMLRQLRQGLLDECAAESPAITMVIDLAVMTYANALRVQGWNGDLAPTIEQELFVEDGLRVKLRQYHGVQFDGFAVEEHLRRLQEHLLSLCGLCTISPRFGRVIVQVEILHNKRCSRCGADYW